MQTECQSSRGNIGVITALSGQGEVQASLIHSTFAGSPLSLAQFKKQFWEPYLLSKEDYQEQCKLEIRHEAPADVAAVGGDAIQGI